MTVSPRRTGVSDQRKPMQVPLIPPLPPSNAYDKENQRQAEAQSRSSSSQKTSKQQQRSLSSSLSLTPTSRSSSLGLKPLSAHRESHLKSSPSQPVVRRHSHGSKRRVLRYGETVDSLFCLEEGTTSSQHLQFCRDIAEGPLADKPSAWLRVVQAATNQVAKSDSNEKGKSMHRTIGDVNTVLTRACISCRLLQSLTMIGMDLIRLHRRATSRFSALSEQDLQKDGDNVFELWLSYAQVQAKYGSGEDARLTFRHIQNQHLGVSKSSFYLKFAEFERQFDSSRAIQILKKGIEHKAEPQQVLHDAIKEIQSSTSSGELKKRKAEPVISPKRLKKNDGSAVDVAKPFANVFDSSKQPSNTHIGSESPRPRPVFSTVEKTESDEEAIKSASYAIDGPTKQASNVGSESSRHRPALGAVKKDSATETTKSVSYATESLKQQSSIRSETSRPRSALNTVHKSHEKVSFAEGTAHEPSRNKGHEMLVTKTPTRPPLASGTTRPAFGSVSVLKNASKKPTLITKTPRLSRVGLSGKPMRVNADENTATTDSDSSMDTATQSETIDAKALLENVTDSMDITSTRPVPKISKMDLSYMLNWDPNARRPSISPKRSPKRERNSTGVNVGSNQKESSNDATPTAAKDEEAPSNGSAASLVTSTLTSVHSNAGKTSHSHITEQTNRSDGSDPTTSLDQTAGMVAKSNPDFLPLVSEDNILRVNGVPYVKLGVIGKGGSCKVYRALAKDCSILAIKKVKLGGMDKKAINGYANEIALLKRLRGNPAIIQMYDSEVDLSRKAIFVAMELGEVDLNQVIQQQTLSRNKDGRNRSSLDMNFIRLTWQQMLKAVHSVHEERIIHGDLKPANFLFVRGALKLIDFGIAKAQSDDTTNIYRDTTIGTLNYMVNF